MNVRRLVAVFENYALPAVEFPLTGRVLISKAAYQYVDGGDLKGVPQLWFPNRASAMIKMDISLVEAEEYYRKEKKYSMKTA